MPLLKIEKKYIFVSVVTHTFLVVLLIWFSDFGSRFYLPASAIYVDIVQAKKSEKIIAAQQPAGDEKKPVLEEIKTPKKKKVDKPEKIIIPEKNKAPEKTTGIKETKKIIPEKKIEKKEIQKKDETADADNGFDKMMETIEKVSKEVDNARIAEGKKSMASLADREISGNIEDMRFRLYYDRVWFKIKESWILPDILENNEKKLSVIIMLRVRKDGEIIERSFEKKSGNFLFDNSAMKAVIMANPLPQVPDGLTEDILEIGVRFIPE